MTPHKRRPMSTIEVIIVLIGIYLVGWGITSLAYEHRLNLRDYEVDRATRQAKDAQAALAATREELRHEKISREIESGRIYIICERSPEACMGIE